ncbi:hypothetical protein [Winogradskyella aurantia]|uniref:Glycosyltransferase 2-like domain-containing protein n=1 Tax=Winogradskyella aurantia TaxID=1915063 RepID=A0A265UQX4_9FLAO|nr:hypothetical protein [Winogradskyella aurantia]OZV67632.1 hypothetical protein CA834_11840 [Winogradskyella aurantia]
MLTFIIPVKSQQVSSDWPKFCQLFERTLGSVFNQTDKNYKVVAVCHEIPEIRFKHENLFFVQADFEPPIPRDSESQESLNKRRELDKGKKIELGVEYAQRQFNTDYVMTVDSDDYISKGISAYVNENNGNLPGWYIKNGYIHFEGKNFLFKTYKFSYLCGSSVIVKPELIKYFIGVDSKLYFDHRLKVLGQNISLSELPFSGGIYSMANGENHLMSLTNIKKFNNHNGWMSSEGLRRIYNKFRNYSFRFITPSIRDEFNFY